jgi:hypothetical protein
MATARVLFLWDLCYEDRTLRVASAAVLELGICIQTVGLDNDFSFFPLLSFLST